VVVIGQFNWAELRHALLSVGTVAATSADEPKNETGDQSERRAIPMSGETDPPMTSLRSNLPDVSLETVTHSSH
jgi:hypothetical protein